jgi:5'-nucleotidase
MSETADLPRPPAAGPSDAPPGRGLYCNRTLNLRALKAIGYDMDYTLVHYRVEAWEQKAYDYLQQKLVDRGWPVADLRFVPDFAMRGLIVDTELGHLVKADRFGYVKRAYHGMTRLDFDEQRRAYARTLVDLSDPRWVFLNTFFSLSEACMYAQLVGRVEAHEVPEVVGYADLWARIRHALDSAHAAGRLKQEIVTEPERYVVPDPDTALALLDQKEAGKRLLLITNSEWSYTKAVLEYAIDPFLPSGLTWRGLFDLTIVSSRKPGFFTERAPLFEVVNDEGLLRPCVGGPTGPGVYLGGHAGLVEDYLGVSGSEILYVGDHLYTDVRISKDIQRWRTGLIVRELEDEIAAMERHRAERERLEALMAEKTSLEREQARMRLALQRREKAYGPLVPAGDGASEAAMARSRNRADRLDNEIAPLAATLGSLYHSVWGPLMYAGSDQSHLARQVESYADVYTSRVSNFLFESPFAYLRAPRGRMAHDG